MDKRALALDAIKEINKKKEKYGSSNLGKNKLVVIDYSAPNIGKPMHLGHIRSTILGDSIARIHNFLGFKTKGINYLGDIGLHIGKLILAWELWLNRQELKKNPEKEFLRLYVKFCELEKKEFSENEEEDYEGNEWTKKAKDKLKLLEQGDKKIIKIWKEIEKNSLSGFNRVYKVLNVKFDEVTGQSKYSEAGKKIILKALKEKLAYKDTSSAVFVDLDNLPKKAILRSNGTASYITQDIGAAVSRFNKYNFNEMIYITDYRQQLHFKQLFAILEKFGYNFHKECKHLPFGTINLEGEILATREGKVVLLEDVLNKAIEKGKQEIKNRNSKGNPNSIAVSAIKYTIIKNEPIKDVSFSWDRALSFEGDTGPYLLYSYARAKSILRKAKYSKKFKIIQLSDQEKRLITLIKGFPEIVNQAYNQLSPNLIANYSFHLCQAFNEFYHTNKVLGAQDQEFKLALVGSFSQVLKNALSLLGISVIEKM